MNDKCVAINFCRFYVCIFFRNNFVILIFSGCDIVYLEINGKMLQS